PSKIIPPSRGFVYAVRFARLAVPMRFPLSRRQPRLRLGALALCVALSRGVAFAAALAEVAEEQGSSEVAQAAAPADQPPSEAKPPAQGAGPESATPTRIQGV